MTKKVRYMGPGDVFDARPIPGFSDDQKFVFYSPTAQYDGDRNPVQPEQRGNVVTVTNDQALELLTHGGHTFVEVEQPATASKPAVPASPADKE